MKDPSKSVTIRVWGDYACFTRPEMKVERVSYPIMTPSAARGVLEAIFWEPQMYYLIDSIAVIKKGRWFSFRRNEVQKTISIPEVQKWMRGTKGVSYIEAGGGATDAAQRNMLALADVDYLITAEVRLTKRADLSRCNEQKYFDEIRRRASRGKCCHRPALGCREFAADFEWVENPSTIQLERWSDEDLGLMLYDVFDPALRAGATDANPHVRPGAVFFHAKIKNAVMDCDLDRVVLVRPKNAEAMPYGVARHVRAWIETNHTNTPPPAGLSPATCGRGLKRRRTCAIPAPVALPGPEPADVGRVSQAV